MSGRTATDFDPLVGQCSLCEFATVQSNPRGNQFWRCLRADSDERFLRYPPLPVADCRGYSPRVETGAPANSPRRE